MLDLMRRPSSILGTSIINDFDKLFENLLEPLSVTRSRLNLPSVDIYSDDDRNMVVEMQAPGYDRKDIDISVNNGVLEIRGARTEKEEQKDKKRSYMVRESSESFARRVVLPDGADNENITAELDKGVLRITVPVEAAQAKRIEIATPKAKDKAKKLTAKAEAK